MKERRQLEATQSTGAGSTPADPLAHPRTIGWPGTVSLAVGGCNQSLFLIGALIVGQGSIPGQGSAAIPLLIVGLLLSWAATPGWTELILLYPNRVGGIASCCAEAFRPISPVLANLAGVCYWWGWVPTCGLTALLSAAAIHQWYLPHIPVPLLAVSLVLAFTVLNLCGVKWVTRFVIPFATMSAGLAFLSGIIPVVTGHVDWHRATTFDLTVPFAGVFGKLTSAMAGLYLVGFAAPAFEAASCHVGETIDPNKNVPRAMFLSAGLAMLYFVVLPVVWLGCIGAGPLSGDLQNTLGPTFGPLLGSAGKAAAIWFMMFNMFHGTLQPLAGASRTLMQLAEDGLLPHCLAKRTKTDAPSVATWLTAGTAIALLLIGDPVWVIAAANLCYLIGICLPNVAVWLLRKDAPHLVRPYRAPRFTIELGVIAAVVWGASAILGFEQFGLPTVIFGLTMAYSGSVLYAWRRWTDKRKSEHFQVVRSIHTKLTGAMLMVLVLDGMGYLLAIHHVGREHVELIAALQDIFVAVALLTITVGLVLPGVISHAAEEVARAADRLATGPLADFTTAIEALGQGDIERAHARVDVEPIVIRSADEMGAMAASFNVMQLSVVRAAIALDNARDGLSNARAALTDSNERYELAIRGSNDGLWDWDIIRNVVYFSPRWKAMIGYEDSEFPNEFEAWTRIIHPDDVAHTTSVLDEYLTGKAPNFEVEFRMRHQDGSYRWILSRGVAIRDVDGVPYRMSGSHTDISERVSYQEDLILSKEAAEAASEAKSLFLANMSHELRTPMNAIIGFSDVLMAGKFGELNEKQSKFVKTISNSGQHLLHLINDVLDLAKVEAGHMDLDLSTFDSQELINSSIDGVRSLADKKAILLEADTVSTELEADRGKVQQILYNLLSNAIKFSPDGSKVRVLSTSASASGRACISITVIDNGIGLKPEDQTRIFNQFEQVDSSYSRAQQGTGLGLTLSRKMVELHGGELSMSSEGEGKGSTFTFTIPISQAEAPGCETKLFDAGQLGSQVNSTGEGIMSTPHLRLVSTSTVQPAKVLVIEANEANRSLMRELLSTTNLILIEAASAEHGIELACEDKPDIIFMDIALPGMDGLEATRALRADPRTAHIPIIALTSHASPGDEELARNAGCDTYITKPIDTALFQESVSRILDRAKAA